MQASFFSLSLEQTYYIAPGVKQFVLSGNPSVPFSFIPGQFITCHFEVGEKKYKRSYSIANPPSESGRIEFAASYIENGPGSLYLFNLEVGATLSLSGPYGRLVLKEPIPQRYIFVGTGTGVTPYRAMRLQLESLLASNPNLEVVLMQGARTRDGLLYAKEFREWAQANSQVTFLACLSREADGKLEADERAGHVQLSFPELHLEPSKDTLYLCGNPQMIDEAFELLIQQGFNVSQIIREKYISQGK